jgi:hypothetical protein
MLIAQPILKDLSSGEKTRACLESLATVDQTRFVAQTLSRSRHACQWIQGHQRYAAWVASNQSSLLCISAKAGCGKTTIAAHISRTVRTSSSPGDQNSARNETRCLVLSFFFRKTNQANENTALAALKSITSQLARQEASVLPVLIKRYESLSVKGAFEWPWDHLSATLVEMLDIVPARMRIYIIIDALDECESDRRRLLDWLNDLVPDPGTVPWGNTSAQIKVVITSRPGGETLACLEAHPTLAMTDAETASDIRALVHEKLDILAHRRGLGPEVISSIERFLLKHAHGMFLWVVMVFEELEKRDERLSNEVIAAKLSKIPLSLVDTYKAMLRDAPAARKRDMWIIIRWILFGSRGLTVMELKLGLCLEVATSDWYDFTGDLELLCGSLIRFDGPREEISFVHQTVRSFLQSFTATSSPEDLAGVHMDPATANEQLATTCLDYLLRVEEIIGLDTLVTTVMAHSDYLAIMNNFLREKPFLRYATESWVFHVRETHAPSRTLVAKLHNLLISEDRRQGIMILHYFINKHGSWSVPQPTTPLHTAAYFNLHWLLEAYPSEYVIYVNSQADMGDTPLVWASEMGNAVVVEWLLKMGADPNKCEYDGWSALHWAARNGHVDVAKLLLSNGAHIDQQDGTGHVPLDWALDRGHWDVVDVLQHRAGYDQFAITNQFAQRRDRTAEVGGARTLRTTWKLWDDRP